MDRISENYHAPYVLNKQTKERLWPHSRLDVKRQRWALFRRILTWHACDYRLNGWMTTQTNVHTHTVPDRKYNRANDWATHMYVGHIFSTPCIMHNLAPSTDTSYAAARTHCAAYALFYKPQTMHKALTINALTCVSKNPLYSGVERSMFRVRCHSFDSLLWLYDYIAVRNYITIEDVTTTERVLRHLCACYDHYQAFAAVKPPMLSLAILFPLQPSRIWQWRQCVGACCCYCWGVTAAGGGSRVVCRAH